MRAVEHEQVVGHGSKSSEDHAATPGKQSVSSQLEAAKKYVVGAKLHGTVGQLDLGASSHGDDAVLKDLLARAEAQGIQALAPLVKRFLEEAAHADPDRAQHLVELVIPYAHRYPALMHAVTDAQVAIAHRRPAAPVVVPSSDVPVMRALHQGDHGPDVVLLKQKLLEKGFQSMNKAYQFDPKSDAFDKNTWIAVRKFRWSVGQDLGVKEGTVDQDTWKMLLGHGTYVDLDDASDTRQGATPGYDAALAAGMAKRKTWQDQAYAPPTSAKPGDYGVDPDGEGWAMTARGEIRIGGDTTWRYCNPGNILPGFMRTYSVGAITAVNVQQPSGLAMFATMTDGWNALHALLLTRGGMHGPYRNQTVGAFTLDYLGVQLGQKSNFGDDPDAYSKRVQSGTGLDQDRVIGTLSEPELQSLMHAINATEGNRSGKVLTPSGDLPEFYAHAFDP